MIANESIMTEQQFNRGFYLISLGSFLVMLSLATHLPVYPHILNDYNLTPGYAVWMQLGLAVGLTGFQPFLGWLSDASGIKKVIMIGAIFMIIGSILIATSLSFWLLILGLFFKGIAGAAVAPAGIAYAGKYAIGEKRSKSIGTFLAIITIGALFGPLVSGGVTDVMNWQAVFFLNAILGIVAFLLFSVIPKDTIVEKLKLDFAGFALIIIVLASLLTVPTFINSYGFNSPKWFPSLIIFAVTLFILIKVEKKQKQPLLDVDYSFKKVFWAPSLLEGLLLFGYAGVMYILTFFIQDVQEKSATTVGFLQMAIFAGTALGNYLSGLIMKSTSARKVIGGAIAMMSIGVVMLLFVNIDTSFTYLLIAMLLMGIGAGFVAPPVKAIVVSEASQQRINTVTFTNIVTENIAQRLGASFALVLFALFTISGTATSSLTNIAWIIVGFNILSALCLFLIPKRITGIHDVETEATKEEAL